MRLCARAHPYEDSIYLERTNESLQFHSVLRLNWGFLLFLFLRCIRYFLTCLRGNYSTGRVVKLGAAICVTTAPARRTSLARRILFALSQVLHDSGASGRT